MDKRDDKIGRLGLGAAFALALAGGWAGPVSAQTMDAALARAYSANPTLNAQRASVRATDENVPQAKAGYRPRITASADIGASITDAQIPAFATASPYHNRVTSRLGPRGAGVQIDQNIFDSGKTRSAVSQSESQVLGARATLRNTEQNVLLDAATSYMNVLRDTAILNLQRNNVEVLEEQLRQTRDRFQVGEVTRTDVAQAEARLSSARSQAILAESNLKTSVARFRQNVGAEPRSLAPGRPVENLLPKTLPTALNQALSNHPAIIASLHGVDAAELQVKVTEADLYPVIGVRGVVQQRYDTQYSGDQRLSASIVGTLTIPIYEGGQIYARTRQAKETAGQRRIEVDTQRDTVRAAVVSAWGGLEAARAQITAAQAQVEAATTALSGVREEAKVGQRTTLDVLNAQQELVSARSSLVVAQRDRVVASYAVLSAVGKLSAQTLKLKAEAYDARLHYEQVKDKLWGTQTPDGR
ncbi:TolC family outer membrane protein [Bosea sp. (in: a-proteobacteria)]|uniref:TolC family outer membrane protein n=1 Tax=Bosea sp. (in: a-proteobacteria) TaxID=1871050 RepID=UPI0026096BBA|nr:TolC family outer membrane protein [Bosea sp. (in: a-proteobacteria)]MCO5093314.1 TolC family outer membrane protein [Bosea sp. (in: a-proteobacteria)]